METYEKICRQLMMTKCERETHKMIVNMLNNKKIKENNNGRRHYY